MTSIKGRSILLNQSEILYDRKFTEQSLKEDWEITAGEWWTEDGIMNGRFRGNGGGILYSKASYPGDIMLDFYGRTVAPSNNDLNFTWCSAGWDFEKNDSGIGYIAGLQGWWESKVGIERYPKCVIAAKTAIFDFEPGRFYHIQAGILHGSCFIFIDDRLAIEMSDPDPIDSNKYGRIGLGTYCSFNQYKDFKIYKLASEKVKFSYTPQF
jgi:hypothetical protein